MSEGATYSERDWLLLLDALVSYADGCTLPHLTPSCPFYKESAEGPTCHEQCRELTDRLNGPARPVQKLAVDGLVMKGRRLPISAAAGYEPYDARQRFVQERTLDRQAQSTSTLLLGLRAALLTPILGDPAAQTEQALTLWKELARRRVPVERVVRGALLPDMSRAIVMRAAAPYLVETGDMPVDLSSELRSVLRENAQSDWPAVLSAAAASWESPEEMLHRITIESFTRRRDPLPWATSERAGGPELSLELQLAFSSLFASRIEEWLSRLLEDDLMAMMCAATPPASVLLALSATTGTRDESGLWIWERLTLTHLDEWSTSSLLIEWRMTHRDRRQSGCPPQVLAERRVEPSQLSDLALERLSSNRGHRAPSEGLNAEALTTAAIEHLEHGRWQAAVDIFVGLVALRPTDGDAWNNLGFCQLPIDSELGLRSLQQASLYERHHPFVNTANRTLALHLCGRNGDALRISETALGSTNRKQPAAVLWNHDLKQQRLGAIGSSEPRAYLAELRDHIASGDCISWTDRPFSSTPSD